MSAGVKACVAAIITTEAVVVRAHLFNTCVRACVRAHYAHIRARVMRSTTAAVLKISQWQHHRVFSHFISTFHPEALPSTCFQSLTFRNSPHPNAWKCRHLRVSLMYILMTSRVLQVMQDVPQDSNFHRLKTRLDTKLFDVQDNLEKISSAYKKKKNKADPTRKLRAKKAKKTK